MHLSFLSSLVSEYYTSGEDCAGVSSQPSESAHVDMIMLYVRCKNSFFILFKCNHGVDALV